jgi:hypothetical protein
MTLIAAAPKIRAVAAREEGRLTRAFKRSDSAAGYHPVSLEDV